MGAMLAAGGSVRQHAFISKVPIIHTDPAVATARIVEQLNAGHAGVMLQEVESADEVRAGLAAMRFKSKGGTRPDEGVGLAAAYWGLSEASIARRPTRGRSTRTASWSSGPSSRARRASPTSARSHRCRDSPSSWSAPARWAACSRQRARTGSGCATRLASMPASTPSSPPARSSRCLQPSGQQPRRDRGADGARLHACSRCRRATRRASTRSLPGASWRAGRCRRRCSPPPRYSRGGARRAVSTA